MQYIIYRSSEGDRRITVINGQPYYQSTGINSSMPGIWLPFFACTGSHPIDLGAATPKIKYDVIIANYINFHGHLVKKLPEEMALPINKPDWCAYSWDKNLKEKTPHDKAKKKDNKKSSSDLVFKRLFLKKDLINSLRLTPSDSWKIKLEDIYKQAELDPNQIKLSQQSIVLNKHPEFITSNPDKINDWLIESGAGHVEQLIRQFPMSYSVIWNKSRKIQQRKVAGGGEINCQMNQVRALLEDYSNKNSSWGRFYHWNRTHIKEVETALADTSLNSPLKLIIHLRCSLGDNLKLMGSLEKRLTFMEQQLIVDIDTAAQAVLLFWEWQKKQEKAPTPLSQPISSDRPKPVELKLSPYNY